MTQYILAETPWEKARLGKFTSSEINKLFTLPRGKAAKKAGKMGATTKNYIRSRAAEITTGFMRVVSNWAMEWGNMYEPMAAARLQQLFPGMEYMGKQNQCFFPLTDFSGGSPDCIHLGLNLVFEIKCPMNPENHIDYCLLFTGADLKERRRDYYYQLQMNMICVASSLGIPFQDMKGIFCSFCPIVKEPYRDLKVLEVLPDMEFYERLPKVLRRAEAILAEVVWAMNTEKDQPGLVVNYDPFTNVAVLEEIHAEETFQSLIVNPS